MANTKGEKELKTKYPFESGLELSDKHDGRVRNLIYTKSFVPSRKKAGL